MSRKTGFRSVFSTDPSSEVGIGESYEVPGVSTSAELWCESFCGVFGSSLCERTLDRCPFFCKQVKGNRFSGLLPVDIAPYIRTTGPSRDGLGTGVTEYPNGGAARLKYA